jgi:hypothetical protein
MITARPERSRRGRLSWGHSPRPPLGFVIHRLAGSFPLLVIPEGNLLHPRPNPQQSASTNQQTTHGSLYFLVASRRILLRFPSRSKILQRHTCEVRSPLGFAVRRPLHAMFTTLRANTNSEAFMTSNLAVRRFCSFACLVVLLSFGLCAHAQVPAASANADIVKMIQAGLPEAVILNKIRGSAGSFDTSTDALIALKKAGATDAELTAISAPVVAPVSSPVTPVPPEPVEAFGAQLLRTRFGDPYLQFQSAEPEIFPDGRPSNTAFLVLYKGETAVLVPSSRFYGGDCYPFNTLFLRDRIAVDRYIGNGCAGTGGYIKASIPQDVGKVNLDEYSKASLRLDRNKSFGMLSEFRGGGTYDQLTCTDGKKKPWSDQIVFGVFPIHFNHSSADPMRAELLSPFIDRLMSDFDKTVAEFQRAAGIADPKIQLSSHAQYAAVTLAQANMYRELLNQRLKEGQGNSNGWLTALNAMQGVSNIQQAMAEGKIADANHDVAGQLNAAIDGGRATVDTVNGTAVAPAQTSNNSIQDALHQQQANIDAIAARNAQLKAQRDAAQQPREAQARQQQAAAPQQRPQPSVTRPATSDSSAPATTVCPDVTQPCIPIAQWNQMQAEIASAPVSVTPPTNNPTPWPVVSVNANFTGAATANTHVCPSAGHILTGHYAANDVWEGESIACKPGQQVIITWSGGDNAGSSSAPFNSGTGGGNSGTGGSGGVGSGGSSGSTGGTGSTTGGDSVPGVNSCVQSTYSATDYSSQILFFVNSCSERVKVWFVVGKGTPGAVTIDAGARSVPTGYTPDQVNRAGGLNFYACPASHPVAVDPNGNQIYRPVAQYHCQKQP